MNAREITNLAITMYGAMQKPEEFQKLIELCLEKPHETILEIGSGRGGTLWAFSHLPNNKTVISVDMPGGDFGGGLTEDDRERIENWIDRSKNTFLCAMDSHAPTTFTEVKETIINIEKQMWPQYPLKTGGISIWDSALPKQEDIEYFGFVDILMIDGDHTYEGVKKDFEMYSPLVRPGGLIVFHDICDHSETAPTCQVKKFWNELYMKHRLTNNIKQFISEPKTWGGLGVIEWQ